MGEVRRYFCCTDNLSGCKILGGVQLTFVGIIFILTIIDLAPALATDHGRGIDIAVVVVIVIFGVMLLIPILLVVGAAKRNSCLLMAWLILNGMVILCCVIALFKEVGDAKIIVRNLVGLGLAIH